MTSRRNLYQFLFIFLGIILFFFAITIWWLSLANPDLVIWSIILFFISILLLFTMTIYFIFDINNRLDKIELIYKIKAIENDSPLKSIDIKVVSLGNWEKRIINHLKDHNGELTQTEIKNLTGLSRSNLSKHLNSLEQKNIVQKESYKRTNRIILVKNIIS